MKTISRALFRRDIAAGLILVSMAIVSSCKEPATAPMPQLPAIVDWGHQGPRTLERFTLPLQGNNEWVYIDSNLNFAEIRIEKVVHVATEDGIFRYQITGSEPFGLYLLFDFVYVRNDTVFLVNPNSWVPGSVGILYLPAYQYRDTATFLFPGSIPTRVYPLGHTLTTPAGVFDSVYVYDSKATNGLTQYFRPGVGVLETRLVDPRDCSIVYVKSQLAYYLLNSY
jgi:hypothetical protein